MCTRNVGQIRKEPMTPVQSWEMIKGKIWMCSTNIMPSDKDLSYLVNKGWNAKRGRKDIAKRICQHKGKQMKTGTPDRTRTWLKFVDLNGPTCSGVVNQLCYLLWLNIVLMNMSIWGKVEVDSPPQSLEINMLCFVCYYKY